MISPRHRLQYTGCIPLAGVFRNGLGCLIGLLLHGLNTALEFRQTLVVKYQVVVDERTFILWEGYATEIASIVPLGHHLSPNELSSDA